MINNLILVTKTVSKFASLAISGLLLVLASNTASAEAQIIELTQTGCQFLEPEAKDHMYETESAADCEAINDKTGEGRLAGVEPMKLKAGKYIFRVTNKNVSYGLGFWLRGSGIGRVTLPSVSGGGLTQGKTLDYEITLEPGKYVYSCPLNPTPDYPIVVEG